MYDRAPRNISEPLGGTAGHVGPGAYDVDSINYKKIKADGYAPFSSMTNRESILVPPDTVIAAPGPGQYDPRFPQDNIKGGKTMANRTSRFVEKQPSTESPGPGSYSLSKKSDWLKTERLGASSAPSVMQKKQSGMLMTSRIRYHRKPVAPSIPTPGQAYGYEENDDGSLRKQDAPDRDVSMGPAYYGVAQQTNNQTTENYKGIHFGNMASRRMNFAGKDGPGPGEYEPYIPDDKQTVATNINVPEEERRKFDAKLPRYHELVGKDEEKKAVPGPGKYEVRGQFDPSPPKVNTEGIEVEHPPFGSQAKRFNEKMTKNPSPGTYNDPRTALDSLKRVTGLKRSPFGQTSVRFTGEAGKKTPGPGQYSIPGLGQDSMKKAYIESTRRGAFGTTSVRIAPITKKGEPELPGPSHYKVSDHVNKPRYKQLSSNFASLSNRLAEPPSIVKDLPPPGSYDVQRSYQQTQSKMHAGKPRTDSAKRKQGAFQSSSSRFAPPRDVVLAETDPTNPGPGAYDSRLNGRIGNPMITKDKRFNITFRDEVPGPGAYEYSPLIQDTVLKGTFNATLNNPIASRLEVLDGPGNVTSHPFLLGV